MTSGVILAIFHIQKVQTIIFGNSEGSYLSDYSKPFDKVAHERLFLKLHQYGIRGDTLNWIKDFLDNWKQTVVINGINSDKVPVSSGRVFIISLSRRLIFISNRL